MNQFESFSPQPENTPTDALNNETIKESKLSVQGKSFADLDAMPEEELEEFLNKLTPDEQMLAAKILRLDEMQS